jgi:hypothetical protein
MLTAHPCNALFSRCILPETFTSTWPIACCTFARYISSFTHSTTATLIPNPSAESACIPVRRALAVLAIIV